MTPLVSVILPSHNGERTIARAIESVLGQSFRDFELLVMDDGSTDGTAAITAQFAARDPRVRLISNETNLGIQKTLNRGLSEAVGKYVARIDDDDLWSDAGKLSAQVSRMKADRSAVLIGTGVIAVDAGGRELFRFLFPEGDEAIRHTILFKNCFAHPTVLFSREAALAEGGYGEGADVRHVEDYDLWLRLGLRGRLANVPVYAATLTTHAGSISGRNKREQLRKNLALIRRHRHDYPGYARAALVGRFRLWLYSAARWLVPDFLLKPFIGWYKKNW